MSWNTEEGEHTNNEAMYYFLHSTLSWESESNLSALNSCVFENYLHKLLYSKNRNTYRTVEKYPNSYNKNKDVIGRNEVSPSGRKLKKRQVADANNRRYKSVSSLDDKTCTSLLYSSQSVESIQCENLFYTCNVCNKAYFSKGSLKKHRCTQPSDEGKDGDQDEKKPSHNYSLKSPKLYHTCDKSFTCDICDSNVAYTSLPPKKYKYTQSLDKQFMCQTCGKHFNHSSSLSRHRLTHTDSKRFFCDVCGKTFTQGSSLKTHQYIHTGEKPFNCKMCGKRFNSNSNLKAHLVTHTGKRAR